MSRPKPTPEDLRQRKKRSTLWKQFRRDHLFTQKRLADHIGISRRTVQEIEAGRITPHPDTLRMFEIFRRKHESRRE